LRPVHSTCPAGERTCNTGESHGDGRRSAGPNWPGREVEDTPPGQQGRGQARCHAEASGRGSMNLFGWPGQSLRCPGVGWAVPTVDADGGHSPPDTASAPATRKALTNGGEL